MKSKPLIRKTGLRTSGWLRRHTPISRVSERRQATLAAREAVRKEVLARDNYTCQAKGREGAGKCWGRLEVDEIISRARKTGGELNPDNCQVLCHGHNILKEDDPDWAIRVGLAKHSWQT